MKTSISYILLLIIAFLPVTNNTFSLDTTSTKYMPLKTGNFFVYYYQSSSGSWRYRTTVYKDSVFNNHKYFKLVDSDDGYSRWVRVDSVRGTYMEYEYPGSCPRYQNEILKDSLAAAQGNEYTSCGSTPFFTCASITQSIVLGITTSVKRITYNFANYIYDRSYAYNFGMYSSHSNTLYFYSQKTLIGARIDGIVYGDTVNPLSVNQISTEVPTGFVLHQNFPNPFNPSTLINFDLPFKSRVKLVIYDTRGQQVAVLAEDDFNTGKYSVFWRAENVSSGIYYYTLTADNFRETRKMVLLK